MHRPIFIISILFFCRILFSQNVAVDSYWLYFTDKAGSTFSIDQPDQFLSQRSIERRAWQSLPVDQSDLPVSEFYLDSLLKLNLQIKHLSKWLNGALVFTRDKELMDTIYQISFIDSIQWNPPDTDRFTLNSPTTIRFSEAWIDPPAFSYGPSFDQVNQVGVTGLHNKGFTGRGVYIAIMDNGFANMPDLQAFSELFSDSRVLSTKNFVDKSKEVYSGYSHGTSVTSTIISKWTDTLIGTAPDATLILSVTENGASETKVEEFAWIEAAEWADSLGADIVNTSLGYTRFDSAETDYDYADMDGRTTYISRAAGMLADKGMIAVSSAGNSGNNPWYYIGAPADAMNILTIGAVDREGTIAGFSSRGPTYDHRIKPDIVAMGYATALQSASGKAVAGNGTSYSSPIIAGACASLWQAYPSMTANDLMRSIIESGDRYRTPDATYGYGIPNFITSYYAITRAPTSTVSTQLKAYPNPFDDYLYIELPISLNRECVIRMYDMQGRIILITSASLPCRVSIPDYLSRGMYLIEVKNNSSSFISRVIKN